MRFEDVFAAGRGPEPEPEPEPDLHEQPAWTGPPRDELGERLPVSAVVARGERAVVALRSLTAYSTGVEVEVLGVARGLRTAEANRVMHEQHVFDGGEEPPPSFLRLGVTFADGRRASNLGGHRALFVREEAPDEPVFVPAGGGGGMSSGGEISLDRAYWLWPLPPGDDLVLACEWPAFDIPLSEHRLDAGAIRVAAERSVRLW